MPDAAKRRAQPEDLAVPELDADFGPEISATIDFNAPCESVARLAKTTDFLRLVITLPPEFFGLESDARSWGALSFAGGGEPTTPAQGFFRLALRVGALVAKLFNHVSQFDR